MLYKTITAILAYACAATAATLPPAVFSRNADESNGPPYAISEMQWSGVVTEGAEPVNLTGSIESVLHQAREINPDFEFQEIDEHETPSVEARDRSDVICNVSEPSSGKANIAGIMNQVKYLKGLSGRCGVDAKSCVRVSCSYQDAVFLCNDNPYFIMPSCKYLAGYVGNIMTKCQNSEQKGCRTCQIGAWNHFVNGQQFDTDNYSVIVARDNSC